MTAEADRALTRAGFSRRDFLKGSGALIVAFGALDLPAAVSQIAAQGLTGPSSGQVDSWIAIDANGVVTAFTGKCELGTGLSTAQMQLVAEELSVAVDRVRLVQCDTALTPDQSTTSGQQSHKANFNRANLALAAATAREALLRLASERLGVPVDRLTVRDGVVSAGADAATRVDYGALVGGKKLMLTLSKTAKRKPPAEWTVLGTSVPRLDMAAMVTGQLEYVHNVRVPGMLHGRVIRPPSVGATLAGVDESSVRGMPGIVKVVVKKDFVGVVAEKPWQAIQAAAKLKVNWRPGAALPPQRGFYEQLQNAKSAGDTTFLNSGDVDEVLGSAASVIRATYVHPYQMHGSNATSCAVAQVQGNNATLWSATQAIYTHKQSAAMLLGIPPDNVRVIFARGAGCHGLNGADTVTFDAALLSQAVGRPVRVQLSSKDEMAWENFGVPFTVQQKAGVDKDGGIVAWDCEAWLAGRGGRPGTNTPGNVVTGALVGFTPTSGGAPSTPPLAPNDPLTNNGNPAPSYVVGSRGGQTRGGGVVKSERVLLHRIQSPFLTGPLRSGDRAQNTFAHECFMDEIAAHVEADPVAFRLRHLKHRRLAGVVSAVAKAANWQPRPSPRVSPAKANVTTGRGIACVSYEVDNGWIAMVAEVEVHRATGVVKVKRLVAAVDCGPVSNPDGLTNQIEGGALHGMSRALFEEVTWDDRKITSIDWRTYKTFPVGFEVPKMDVVLLDKPDEEATGAGEMSITVATAAIGNAIFDATGIRLRQVPFTPTRVKAALAART